MKEYRKEFREIKLLTYEDVKKTIDNMENIAGEFDVKNQKYNFYFKCGGASCQVDSVHDFINEAYGRDGFQLISMQMLYFLPDNQHMAINYLCGIHVSASDNIILEKVINKLNFDFEHQSQANPVSQSTQTVINNNTTVVNGDGNYVANGGGSINHAEHKKETTEDKKENFFQKHPVITGILGATVAGVLLMFNFWEDLVEWIEHLFS